MELIKPGTKIPFTNYRKLAVILSTVVNLIVLAFLFFKGPSLGVDFAGGTIVQLKFQPEDDDCGYPPGLGERSSSAAARFKISAKKAPTNFSCA